MVTHLFFPSLCFSLRTRLEAPTVGCDFARFYELTQGAKHGEAANLSSALAALLYIEMTSELWVKAGNLTTYG